MQCGDFQSANVFLSRPTFRRFFLSKVFVAYCSKVLVANIPSSLIYEIMSGTKLFSLFPKCSVIFELLIALCLMII